MLRPIDNDGKTLPLRRHSSVASTEMRSRSRRVLVRPRFVRETRQPNTHRRRDSTRLLRRVGGVYWTSEVLYYTPL